MFDIDEATLEREIAAGEEDMYAMNKKDHTLSYFIIGLLILLFIPVMAILTVMFSG